MNFQTLKTSPNFSFLYDGESSSKLIDNAKAAITERGDECETVFTLPDGLEITQKFRFFKEYNACEWVIYFYNKSKNKSGLITELFDCDIRTPFEFDEPPVPGYAIKEGTAKIYNPIGSYVGRDEFLSKSEYILPGKSRTYSCRGGRSSSHVAPFFDINKRDKGVICAIGWTGQWHAVFSRDNESINIKTGIENIGFRLLPDEKIRTSSVVLLEYDNGQNCGHNKFRRLVKEQFSLIGKAGRPAQGPLCSCYWGALPSDKMIERIDKITKHDLGFEYFWVDAGWYGSPDSYCPNEHVGDWGRQTGNWAVNKKVHPDDLLDVARAIKENNMKFLLWIEPERVISSNPMPQKHPDWFFKLKDDTNENATWLLNLGNPEALEDTIKLVSGIIEKYDLGCYRQDFNTDALRFWLENDEPERKGINEIKHIMGLYKFWDTLLERFPNLIIDNCASGGRRVDIETLRRSIPLWRSDYQCTFDYDAETSQTQNMGISWWIPYSGTGIGKPIGDTYRARSCYSSALATNFWGYEDWEFGDDQPFDWVRKINSEYKRARPYFSCDYYPLTVASTDDGTWAASQYDRPEMGDGIVLAFRRPLSPFETAEFELGGIRAGDYYFEDADTGEVTKFSSSELSKNGFKVTIPQKRRSKLYFYTVK